VTSERELKLPVEDRVALRRCLRERGADLVHEESFENNLVWDRGGELAAAGRLLRLRIDGQGARLTWKGPASFEGGLKIRTEHETFVGDVDEMAAILESLGYELVRRYEKYREEWQLDEVIIAVDRTPIGDFVEFEGKGAVDVATGCGFDPAGALRASYLALYEEHRRRHAGASRDMVFPAEREHG